MITEVCMNMSWDFEKVLSMKMVTFMMFLNHSREINERRKNEFLLELTGVMGVTVGGGKYQEAMQSHYSSKLMTEKQREKSINPRLFDASDKEQADQAAEILASTFKKKLQLMGL